MNDSKQDVEQGCVCLIPDLPGADCAACLQEASEWAEQSVAIAAADDSWPKWDVWARALAHDDSCGGCDLCAIVSLDDLTDPARRGSEWGGR